jgi:hypothetical protein
VPCNSVTCDGRRDDCTACSNYLMAVSSATFDGTYEHCEVTAVGSCDIMTAMATSIRDCNTQLAMLAIDN